MKRMSKKLGFSGKYYPHGPWTKYDERLQDGIENNDIIKVKIKENSSSLDFINERGGAYEAWSAMRKNGVSCVKQDSNGSTALHRVCMKGQANLIKIMLKAEKPDLTVLDSSGKTPLHVASQEGHTECIRYLLHFNSPLDIQDPSSMTPLHYAVIGCYEDSVALLLKNGAPVNIKEKEGRSALSLAAEGRNERIFELLCQFGAHLNSQDSSGKTALMHAAEKGMENIVELLLLKGADAKIEDINGKTAEDLAKSAGNDEIFEIISNHLRNKNDIEAANGTNGFAGHDNTSEFDSTTAEDNLTLNSSSSFGEMESMSESSPRSPDDFQFAMMEPFDLQKELQNLKMELKNETLKRTKAEKDLRSLRMQLEVSQVSDEETPVRFEDHDSSFILSEIEKNIPSPLKELNSTDEEDSPLVSSLRGEVYALEAQIERLKKDLESYNNNNNNETKIPLTVYKALKESHQNLYDEMKRDLDKLQNELNSEKDKKAVLVQENENLKVKLNEYKDAIEKNDKKEKIRELNEKIVSLKIELSQMDKLREENGDLREQMESLNMEKEAEIQRLKEKLDSFKRQHNDLVKIHDKRINGYRRALMSAFQGHLDLNLATILCEISKLQGCMITEL